MFCSSQIASLFISRMDEKGICICACLQIFSCGLMNADVCFLMIHNSRLNQCTLIIGILIIIAN